jgi:uncharacterized membrane protein
MLSRIKSAMRKHFLTGLLIFVPMALTIFLLTWIDGVIMEQIAILPDRFNPQSYLPFAIPGLGIILTLIFIYVIGVFGTIYMGRSIVNFYESILEKVPGVRWLYVVAKQIMEAIFRLLEEFQSRGDERFRGVVMVEYPRKGIYSLAFVTSDTKGEVQERTDSEVVNIFLPTTPNPTSGFYLMIPKEQLIPLEITVEQAFRMIISAGMVGGEDNTIVEGNKKAASKVEEA